MFVHTFIRGFQWTFSLYRNFKESLFNKNHFILVIKFENLKLRKSWVSQKKKKNSQYSLAVNKFPRFLSSGARTTIFNRLAFPKFQRFLDNISSFQQIVQNSSVDMLPRNTSLMLCQRRGCFFRAIIDIRGLISQPRVFKFSIFFRYFC